MKRLPLIVSFLLFIALCASIAYWGLQLFKPPTRPVAAPPRVARADISPDEAAALFGGRPGKVAAASNYQLKGVILSGTENDSVAILSADGKPAQAVGVGSEVVPGVTVKEVHREYVLLSEGGAVKRVDLPENAKMQVNIASAAPAGVQEGTGMAPSPARNPSTPQTPAATPAPAPAATPGQTTGARSPLLPPPAPQAQQQGQVQPPSHTAPAVPARVVVSPPPAAQTTAPAVTPAPAPTPAPTPTPTPTPTPAPATPLPPVMQPPAAPAPAPATGTAGEMLPPPSLQSR